VNVASWFITSSNVSASYTASWPGNVVGIANPTSYTISQTVGTTITFKLVDPYIDSYICSRSVELAVTAAPPAPAASFSTGVEAVASSYASSPAVYYNPSQTGQSTLTVTTPITIWVDCESPSGIYGSANLYLRTAANGYIPGIPSNVSAHNSGYTTGHSIHYSLTAGTYLYMVQANVASGPGNIRATIQYTAP
jgi:hypothetical protein